MAARTPDVTKPVTPQRDVCTCKREGRVTVFFPPPQPHTVAPHATPRTHTRAASVSQPRARAPCTFGSGVEAAKNTMAPKTNLVDVTDARMKAANEEHRAKLAAVKTSFLGDNFKDQPLWRRLNWLHVPLLVSARTVFSSP